MLKKNPFGLSDEGTAKLELAVAAAACAIAFVEYVAAAQRLAVERDRKTRLEREQRVDELTEEAELREAEAREKFREDIAAGVRAAGED